MPIIELDSFIRLERTPEGLQRRADLRKVLLRGLNTWPEPPKWLLELQRELISMDDREKS